MNDQRWGALGEKIEPSWRPERERVSRAAIDRRASKRRAMARAGAVVAALALVAGGAGAIVGMRTHAPPATEAVSLSTRAAPAPMAAIPAAPTAVATVTVTQLSPETVLDPMPDHHGRGFALRSGGARFMASHDAGNPFTVIAGDLTIEDLGTIFTVQYLAADKVEVAVEEGSVKVHARGAEAALGAGERRAFAVSPSPAIKKTSRALAEPSSPTSWRLLAKSGRYDEAHAALKKAGPNAVRDETADLLLAADTARLGGYPAGAVPYLERVVRTHAGDPRSSLASFTLGRVLLDELGRPAEAAEAFARARGAGGPLAEDALAREVEAASRAGDVNRSHTLAREYQRLYPSGRRAKAVARFGGVD
jgi:transmembrane sensor